MTWLVLNRAAVLLSAALWIGSLLLPSCATPIEELSPGNPYTTSLESGWSLALLGWGGATEGFFPWYANPILAWCCWRLWQNSPQPVASTIAVAALSAVAVALASTVFTPRHIDFGDDHGVNGLSYPVTGAYVWVASFYPVLIASCVAAFVRLASGPAATPAAGPADR